jgi:hypothetical protein
MVFPGAATGGRQNLMVGNRGLMNGQDNLGAALEAFIREHEYTACI